MLGSTESEDCWHNFDVNVNKVLELRSRGNVKLKKISQDENSRINMKDTFSKNQDMKHPNSLLIGSDIPSTILKYPRRIILGLCMKLRRKKLLNLMENENGMSSSCSSYSCGDSSSINNSNNSLNSRNCQLFDGHSLEGETLKFRRRKDSSQHVEVQESTTINDNSMNTNAHGKLKLENNDSQTLARSTAESESLESELAANKNVTRFVSQMTRRRLSISKTKTSTSNSTSTNARTSTGTGTCTGTGTGTDLVPKTHQGFEYGPRLGGRFGYDFWRTLFLVLFYLLILVDLSVGCGPGRGAGRRRAPRKLTPLVYKQHVPNVPENTLSASGLNEGQINRDNPKFKALVPNYSTDIIFRDDEGTGADRLMSQRCKEKLNTLAISVMNQWPGVRLRVIEGWDEGNHHSTSSLHYEGRAVDITTSDKDRSKYGMLARLAVEAGFDWVYYESRAHIHCSVKSDSSQAARTGGCFSENATVVTTEGRRMITEVRPGDSVLSVNEKGETAFSEVVMFLDRNSTETREFYHVTTSSGTSLALTPSHLIFKVDRVIGDNMLKMDLNSNSDSNLNSENMLSSTTSSSDQLIASAQVTFAKNIEAGDWLLVVSESTSFMDGRRKTLIQLEKVVHMEAKLSTGVYAPLTKQGNVIVDNILASCYAVVNDQSLAHWAFSPVRFVVNVYEAIGHAWRQFSRFVTFRPIHSHNHLQQDEDRPNSSALSSSPSLSSLSSIQDSVSSTKVSHKEGPAAAMRRDGSSSSSSSSSGTTRSEQGVHWYASFLYASSYYFIPSNLLYDSS